MKRSTRVSTTGPVRVLHTFPQTAARANPYLALLSQELARVDVRTLPFTWTRALLGRYDAVHLHWPEAVLYATTPLRRLRKQLLFALWVLRLEVLRIPVVRTVHNVEPPQGLPGLTVILLALLDRRVRVRVRLSPLTPVPDEQRAVTVPHGHYRDWIATYPTAEPVPGRLTFAGQVRRYKGVETLVEAYADARADLPELTLEIGGAPSSPEIEATVRRMAAGLPGVRLTLQHLEDADLVRIVTEAELVVLPYRFMHNSGTVLYALSLGRPVLVPDNDVNRALSDEVGPGWVHRFSGVLDGPALTAAVAALRCAPPDGAPDLSAREWTAGGAGHLEAYRLALGGRRSAGPMREGDRHVHG